MPKKTGAWAPNSHSCLAMASYRSDEGAACLPRSAGQGNTQATGTKLSSTMEQRDNASAGSGRISDATQGLSHAYHAMSTAGGAAAGATTVP